MIINEVLCTAIYRIHANAAHNLFYVLNNFYNEDEISNAKRILWDNAPHDKIGEFQRRNNNSRRPAKSEHTMDIIKAIQKLDAAEALPDVAAQNLDKIPPMLPEELNMMLMLQRISKLEKCREQHTEIITQMAIEVMELQEGSRSDDITTDDVTNNRSQNDNAVIGDSNRGNSTQVPQITVTPPSPPEGPTVNNHAGNNVVISKGTSNSGTTIAGDETSNIMSNNVQQTNSDRHSSRQGPPPISGQRWGPPGTNAINQSGLNGNANNEAQASILSSSRHNSVGQRRQRSSSSSSTQWGSQQQAPHNRRGHRGGQYNRRGGNRGSAYHPRMNQPPRANPHNRTNHRQDEDGWRQVMSRSRRRKIYGNGASSGELEGAPLPIRKIWVSRVHNGNIQKVERYMMNKNIEYHNIEQVSNVDSVYSSYKITIPITAVDNVFDSSFWPPGVRCQMWKEKIPRDMDSDDDNNNSSTNRNSGFWGITN